MSGHKEYFVVRNVATLGTGVQVASGTITGSPALFGGDIVEKFNRENNIDLICRAHQLVMEGHKSMFNDTLVTIWSAPNYCYRCGNVAAILELDENLKQFYKIFEAAPQEARGVPAKKPAPDYFL